MFSAALYARVRLTTPLHTRPRVQRAPGIPCALYLERSRKYLQTSGAMRRETADAYSAVIARFNRATLYSRDAND